MGILFVNGSKKGLRAKGRAVIGKSTRRRVGKMPPALARWHREHSTWARKGRAAKKKRKAKPRRGKAVSLRRLAALRALAGAASKGKSKSMAKKKRRKMSPRNKRRARRRMLGVWRKRRKARKYGRIGRTRRRKALLANPARRKRRRARKAAAPRKAPRRGRRRKARRSRASYRRAARLGQLRKRAGGHGRYRHPYIVRIPRRAIGGGAAGVSRTAKTVALRRSRLMARAKSAARLPKTVMIRKRTATMLNPGRRRYRRSYRRNPSMSGLMSLAKQAVPVLLAMYGSRALVGAVGGMIPGVSSLGSLAQPALQLATIFGIDFLAPKISVLNKHKSELLVGAALALLDSAVKAFAPASVKSMIGMGDYVQMGDYIAVGGVPPLNENITLSDYIAVGGDGIQEELGLEEELGVDEELGGTMGGLMGGGGKLLAPVPTQNFLAPVPARSFTKVIPPAGTSYDSSADVYTGIFAGKFGS